MNKKRILFLIHTPPPIHGSSVVGLQIQVSKLIDFKFESVFINLLLSRKINETGHIKYIKYVRSVWLLLILIKQILNETPNLVYYALTATGMAFYRDVILISILKLFRVRIVYHLHNKGISDFSQNRINSALYRFVFKNEKVILLSSLLYRDISMFVNSNDVYICPNGIKDTCLEKPASKALNINSTSILFLSNLIEEKGVYILLEACEILTDRDVSYKCLVAGSEGDISTLELSKKINELNISESVKYIGKIYGDEKAEILNTSDIFVFPTFYRNETFGLVNLEAMQHSLPVVSTFEGGIPDIVDDGVTGFLIPQKDAEALADKLEILINNPELRKQMGEAGRRKYEEQFTLEKFENRLVEILEDILEKQNK